MSCYFWPTLAPSLPSVTHPGTPPQSTSHISVPLPIFSRPSTKPQTKAPCTNSLAIVRRGLCLGVLSGGLLSGRFCLGWFLSVPFLSEYICYNRKLNITLDFMFHMYDTKMYKCDVTCSLPLLPSVTNCHTFSHPLPLERDVLYGRLLTESSVTC